MDPSLDSAAQPPATRWLNAAIACLILSVVFYKAVPTIADPDIWGHLRMGLDVWESGSFVPAKDPYSYLNADYPVVDHEWLTQVILAGVYQLVGPTGLVGLKVALALATFAVLYRFLCLQKLDPLRAGLLLLVVLYVFLPILGRISVGLSTYLFFAVLLILLHGAEKGAVRRLWLMPPLIVLWVNLHPGVIAAIGVLGVWAAVHAALAVYQRRSFAALTQSLPGTALLVALASGLATLVNPYGARLPQLLIERGIGSRSEVIEFMPLDILSAEGLAYLALSAAAVAGFAFSRRPRSLPQVAVLACTAVTPFLAVRHMPLYATAVVVLAGEHIAAAWVHWSPAGALPPRLERLLPAPLVAASIVLVGLALPEFGCIRLGEAYGQPFPSRAVALLRDSGVEGNLVILFDWGEYVTWHLAPRIKVSIDGRREVAYPDEIHWLNFRFLHGAPGSDQLLKHGPADLVLVSRKFAAFERMQLEPGWQLIYDDPICGLFARKGSSVNERLRQTPVRWHIPPDGGGTCFPDKVG
jgi:hypothetical protein